MCECAHFYDIYWECIWGKPTCQILLQFPSYRDEQNWAESINAGTHGHRRRLRRLWQAGSSSHLETVLASGSTGIGFRKIDCCVSVGPSWAKEDLTHLLMIMRAEWFPRLERSISWGSVSFSCPPYSTIGCPQLPVLPMWPSLSEAHLCYSLDVKINFNRQPSLFFHVCRFC